MRSIALAAALAAGAAAAHDGREHPAPTITGPADGWVYPLAEPGTYALPPVSAAADATLLDETGAPASLAALYAGRVTVLGFVYTRCGDVCPMASMRMAELQALAAADPEAAGALRLATLSFDPGHDTPERMGDYAAAFRDPEIAAPGWTFLTARSAAEIAPVLAAYGQPVARKRDPNDALGPFSHILRVFLIDGEGRVRNIYSADFLDPRLVLNDVRTLLMERRKEEEG